MRPIQRNLVAVIAQLRTHGVEVLRMMCDGIKAAEEVLDEIELKKEGDNEKCKGG